MGDRLTIEIEAQDKASEILQGINGSVEQLRLNLDGTVKSTESMMSVWKQAEKGAVKLRERLGKTTASLADSGKELVGLAKTIGVDFGDSLTASIGESLSGLPSKMFAWGSQAVSMFASGMNSASGQVASSAHRIADMLAGYFEMHSPTRLGPLSKEDPSKWTHRLVSLLATGLVSAEDALSKNLEKITSMMLGAFDIQDIPGLARYTQSVTSSLSSLYRETPTWAGGYSYSQTGLDLRDKNVLTSMYGQHKEQDELRLFKRLLEGGFYAKTEPVHKAFTDDDVTRKEAESYYSQWFTGLGESIGAIYELLATDQQGFNAFMRQNQSLRGKYFVHKDGKWQRTARTLGGADQSPDVAEGVDTWNEFLNKKYMGYLERRNQTDAFSRATKGTEFLGWSDMPSMVKEYIDYAKQASSEGWVEGFDRSKLNALLDQYGHTKLFGQIRGSDIDPVTGIPVALMNTEWGKAFIRKKGQVEASQVGNYAGQTYRYDDLPDHVKAKYGLNAPYDLETAKQLLAQFQEGGSATEFLNQIFNTMKTLSGKRIIGGHKMGWLGEDTDSHKQMIAKLLGVDLTRGEGHGIFEGALRVDQDSQGIWGKIDQQVIQRLEILMKQVGFSSEEASDYLARKIGEEWIAQRASDLSSPGRPSSGMLSDSSWTSSHGTASAKLLIDVLGQQLADYERISQYQQLTNYAGSSFSAGTTTTGGFSYHSSSQVPGLIQPTMFSFEQKYPGSRGSQKQRDIYKWKYFRDDHGNLLQMPREQYEAKMRESHNWMDAPDPAEVVIAQNRARRKSLGYLPNHSSMGIQPSSRPSIGASTSGRGSVSTSLSVGAIQINQNFNLDLGGYEGSLEQLVSTIAQDAAIEAQKALLEMVEFRGV